MKTTLSFPSYAWRNRRGQLVTVAVLVCVTLLLVVTQVCMPAWWKSSFADYLDPGIAIGTIFVAALVWYNEQQERWKAQLPKRLHIRYLIADGDCWRTHVSVVNAPLAGEDDIRQWGQSIGQTIFPQEIREGEKPDHAWARIHFTGFKIIRLPDGDRVLNYGLLVFLNAPIKGAEDGKVYGFTADGSRWEKREDLPENCFSKFFEEPHPIN